jgi:aspartate/methionine/tyrosine aminotransferase
MENSEAFDAYWHGVMAKARPIMKKYFDLWKADGLVTGVLPDYGCITFPRLTGIDDTMSFSAWLADRYGVIVVPGELFRAHGHVRIGFALPARELERALSHLTEGLREYREQLPARLYSV